MTQLFDQESGSVTPVTVIEAGPCPVVGRAHPGDRRLHRRPARLRRGQGAQDLQARGRAPGHARIVGPHRHVVEMRGVEGLNVGDTVTVEPFEPGDKVKVSGHQQGQGVCRHDQAPQLPPRPRHPRLAQRARAGFDRRVGVSGAGLQGHAHGRSHGPRARHPARPLDRRGGRREEPAAGQGCRPRRRWAASSRSGATADGRAERTRPRRHHQGEAESPTCSASSATTASCTRS